MDIAPTLSLRELVYGPICTSLAPEDRALLLEECIESVAELELECETLRERVDDLEAEAEEKESKHADEQYEEIKASLKALVDAFDQSKIGKVTRVGSLVLIADDGNIAGRLGAVVAKARALL